MMSARGWLSAWLGVLDEQFAVAGTWMIRSNEGLRVGAVIGAIVIPIPANAP